MKKSFGQTLTDAMALEFENIQRQIKSELLQRPFVQIKGRNFGLRFPLN